MYEYCFVLAKTRAEWRLRPRWCFLPDGSWQLHWLCIYAHRVRVG